MHPRVPHSCPASPPLPAAMVPAWEMNKHSCLASNKNRKAGWAAVALTVVAQVYWCPVTLTCHPTSQRVTPARVCLSVRWR